jgi:hypothetical protein
MEKTQINQIVDEKVDITTGITEIQRTTGNILKIYSPLN